MQKSSLSISWIGHRWRPVMWVALATLLLLPLFATAFTDAVVWGPEDFIFAAILLMGFGVTVEIVSRLPFGRPARMGLAGLALLIAALVWAQAAVGIV